MPPFSPKSKHLPALSEFLEHLADKEKRDAWNFGHAFLYLLSGAFLCGIVAGGLVTSGVIKDGAATGIGILACFLGGSMILGLVHLRKKALLRQRPENPIRKKALVIARAMLRSRRLHKELDGPAAQLLEESARFWCDIRRLLDSPYWRMENLPRHWETIRESTLAASTGAMEEQIVVLSDSFHPSEGKAGFNDLLEDFLEKYFTGPQLRVAHHLPIGFDHARTLAEKLKLTAIEIEKASQQMAREEVVQQEFRSSEALDFAIGDLRAIQDAESELRQNTSPEEVLRQHL